MFMKYILSKYKGVQPSPLHRIRVHPTAFCSVLRFELYEDSGNRKSECSVVCKAGLTLVTPA